MYKKWLRLSDEGKENVIQPSPYYTSYYPLSSEKNKLNESFSLARRVFNAVALSTDSTYNLRDYINIKVKDQLDTQTCNISIDGVSGDNWYLWVYAKDLQGDISLVKTANLCLDNGIPIAPTIDASIESGGKSSTAVTFNISGNSSLSGIAKYQYSLDNGETWNDLAKGETLVLNEIGDYEFLARAVNNVGTEGKITDMEIMKVVTRIPLIQFIPDENEKYENE